MEKIIRVLGKYSWQLIPIILGVIAIWIGWEQLQRKKLSYEVITKVKLLEVLDKFKDRLEVSFELKPVQELYVIQLKLTNTGNAPIKPDDYHRPISIGFGQNATVLSYEVLDERPSNLDVNVRRIHPNSVKYQILVEPTLLNTDDSFTIETLVTKLEDINIDARIVGIKNITKFEKLVRPNLIFSLSTNLFYISTSVVIFGVSITNRIIGEALIPITGMKDFRVLLDASNELLIIGIILLILAVINVIPVLKELLMKRRS